MSLARLHPSLQYHVLNTIGWPGLREVQESCVEPVLNGWNIIVQAQTAGGKTEAAFFPLISRMLTEEWRPLSILYVCPLRALLNNQEQRLSSYFQMVGHQAAVWHGDVSDGARNRMRKELPSCLLTTPESLEAMLIGKKTDVSRQFANLRAVVIDEVHAFAGDDRGWHLLAILSRLEVLAGRRLQRIGLSATVGNPEDLATWLDAGAGTPHPVIRPSTASTVKPEVQVDYVGTPANAAKVISLLHRGEKRLVFTDSRSRAEEIGGLLRGNGITAFVTHSSLSRDMRAQAEQAFAETKDCVIVATSALELGIDIGDLDRVIQIDAPQRVASFLQRMGRTGRRRGTVPNCLFLAVSDTGLINATALVHLWEQGYVEPVVPPPLPYHLLAQQILSLCLQTKGLPLADWQSWLRGVPGLGDFPATDQQQLVAHLLSSGILRSDNGLLWFDQEGERLFGRKHFMELVSVFTSSPFMDVLAGRAPIASVDRMSFAIDNGAAIQRGLPTILTLAGRYWAVTEVDWKKNRIYVKPADSVGKIRWRGSPRDVGAPFAGAVRQVLSSDVDSARWSQRTRDHMTILRQQHDWIAGDGPVIRRTGDSVQVWTSAGTKANRVWHQHLVDDVAVGGYDHLSITVPWREGTETLVDRWKVATQATGADVAVTDAVRDTVKFHEAVQEGMLDRMLRARFRPEPSALEIGKRPPRCVLKEAP